MLLLSRKSGESVRIGDAVVTVRRMRGRRVWLGVEAPQSVKILRTELENPRGDDERISDDAPPRSCDRPCAVN